MLLSRYTGKKLTHLTERKRQGQDSGHALLLLCTAQAVFTGHPPLRGMKCLVVHQETEIARKVPEVRFKPRAVGF